eukprot:gnl/MRDRNA2_/MRDRNA2_56305_c0_seq1.p1 gnl/MRDRNA2_/MRDRNA2_56305_c0~~gnl/MRDRNA2_/MRDRNA2_56305_c0_seq1.p1  ORF type:complete len:575 (-),score=117.68 gnl/MRDRNA2_/MRDRNA2_56305_c0_seq1:9-1733(-)
MDALALLSGSDDSDGEGERPQEELAEGSAKRQRVDAPGDEATSSKLSFADLQNQGYTSSVSLLESASYQRDAQGQEERRVKSLPAPKPQQEDTQDEHAEQEEEEETVEASCEVPPPSVEVWQTKGSTGKVPRPWSSFRSESGSSWGSADSLPTVLLDPLFAKGIEAPTPIQSYAIPIIASGRDMIGIAQTGSGKTLAYLLPCFAHLLRPENACVHSALFCAPAILVLGPTRELICQVEKEAERFYQAEIKVQAVYGGAPKQEQLAGLRARPQLVAATPGRLNDFLENEGSLNAFGSLQALISLDKVRFMILDEADRMLDNGFEEQIRQILKLANSPTRQTLMFSATWPPAAQDLAVEILKNPVEVRVGGSKDPYSANPNIKQEVRLVDSWGHSDVKTKVLVSLLKAQPRAKTLVFVSMKRVCADVERKTRRSIGGGSDAIHGDRRQEEREAALKAFRIGEIRVLFATDVAGRGLDIPGVDLVVNYDPPQSASDYVHRIGRTGRGGAKGHAVSLLSMHDTSAMQFIAEVMEKSGVDVPSEIKPFVQGTATKRAKGDSKGAGNDLASGEKELVTMD